ncbi:T9SS type A sorting domain-containing protein [Balneolaceae bacterium ANBcel3]|nr:T9SS type A sorting domain-containing protein [Balneolaceae bacterium ANBcel3]
MEPDSSITIELLFQPFESGNYQAILDISHTALNVSDPHEIIVKGVGKVGTDSEINGEISEEILLKQNYPNPFNPYTVIEFYLPESGHITLEVYDITGRRIEVLVDEFKNAGVHSVIFDSSRLSSGVYRYRIQSEEFVRTRMMTFIK